MPKILFCEPTFFLFLRVIRERWTKKKVGQGMKYMHLLSFHIAPIPYL